MRPHRPAAALMVLTCLTAALTQAAQMPLAEQPTMARSAQGLFISWTEHIIDDSRVGGLELTGSDGLVMGDLDLDGYADVVSVHESDTEYDGQPVGHIRIAWGSADPNRWQLTTLASGAEAAAAEDVAIGDVNGDGFPDVVAAMELAHLLYLQNPGISAYTHPRTTPWQRSIPAITTGRGSYIRSFLADFDGDGKPEVVAANKGAQNPKLEGQPLRAVSIYYPGSEPLQNDQWREQVLTRLAIPINAEPVDLDRDGDLDIVAGSRAEARILWLENLGQAQFLEHSIATRGQPAGTSLTGFNMDYADLNGDGRTDIVSTAWPGQLLWLMQPTNTAHAWRTHLLGEFPPDQLVSVRLADIDGDGDLDAFAGAYSRGPRDHDDPQVTPSASVGRIAWFENPGLANVSQPWLRHDISRRVRGMYDKWLARDLDSDGDIDFVGTRGNSEPYDGVIWLEQVRSAKPQANFRGARRQDSRQLPAAANTAPAH